MTDVGKLIDDQGAPVRWKVATLVAVLAFIFSLVSNIAKAGAKSEQLSTAKTDIEALKSLYPRMDRQETKTEFIIAGQAEISKKLDKLLERRR